MTADELSVGSYGAGRFVRYGGSLALDELFVGSLAGATFEHHGGDLSLTRLQISSHGILDFQDGNLAVQTIGVSGSGADFTQKAGTVTAGTMHIGAFLTSGTEPLYL